MQVSKQQLNKTLEGQVYTIFFQLLADVRNPREAELLFKDLLTRTELSVLSKRVAIALFLDKGRSYENIKSTLKVSSATIASVQEIMGNPGMQLALNKIKAEEWADQWAGKISKMVGKIIPGK